MAAPEYDFFATGPRPAPPAGGSVDRFGTPPAPPAGGAVNQFGLPVDEARPTGPLAAPGYGAMPVQHSLASGYDDAPAVWDPAAAAAAARPHSRAAAPVDVRPGGVVAASVISIVLGVLGLLAGGFVLLGYLGAKSQVEQALAAEGIGDQAGTAQLQDMANAFLAAILIAGLVVTAVSLLYVVMGALLTRGRRWAGWTLVVLSAISILGSIRNLMAGGSDSGTGQSYSVGYGVGTWLGLGASLAILLLLTLGEGGRWLRRS